MTGEQENIEYKVRATSKSDLGWKEKRNALLLVSPGKEEFIDPDKFGAIVDWITNQDNFDAITFFVGGYSERFNISAKGGYSPKAAQSMALDAEAGWKSRMLPIASNIVRQSRASNVVSSYDVVLDGIPKIRYPYADISKAFDEYYNSDNSTLLRKAIHADSEAFSNRQRSTSRDDSISKTFKEWSENNEYPYLIEELKIFIFMAKNYNGKDTARIYPGPDLLSTKVLKGLAPFNDGITANIPKALQGLKESPRVALKLNSKKSSKQESPTIEDNSRSTDSSRIITSNNSATSFHSLFSFMSPLRYS